MELLRVFNKKRLCIFGLMIILNAVLFIMGNKISEQEIIYRDLVNSYNDNISTVSYTHLDVYKRQGYHKSYC